MCSRWTTPCRICGRTPRRLWHNSAARGVPLYIKTNKQKQNKHLTNVHLWVAAGAFRLATYRLESVHFARIRRETLSSPVKVPTSTTTTNISMMFSNLRANMKCRTHVIFDVLRCPFGRDVSGQLLGKLHGGVSLSPVTTTSSIRLFCLVVGCYSMSPHVSSVYAC